VQTITELWRYNRRAVVVGGGLLVGLVVLLGTAALVVHLSTGRATADANPQPSSRSTSPASGSDAPAVPDSDTPTDVASWDAIPAVTPSTSKAYPAIDGSARQDPDAYTRAFASELFTRDYRASDRSQLVAWAQYEDAPLQSPNYPRADWTKVLVDSLTDLTWDAAADTPIPADGPWLALRAEHCTQTVSEVKVSTDVEWEQQVVNGYQPSDPLATVRDVSLTVTQHAKVSGHAATSTFSISLSVQLGSSLRGDGYGVAATNNYLIRQVG
jgi:hypothetical protein